MKFFTTRTEGKEHGVSSSYAILNGLAKDGGLYVPEYIPKLDLSKMRDWSYQEIAVEVLHLFFDDFDRESLERCVQKAYSDTNFTTDTITPLEYVGKNHAFLELFHGRTLAFKDVALSLFPYLLEEARKKEEEKRRIYILTATSGDTGKAAMEGFADVEHMQISVFYPTNGVSEMQKEQMQKQRGSNVSVTGIVGNFDDAQTTLKRLFNDATFQRVAQQNGYLLSSANSMNIGRLLPQVVYYVTMYIQLCKDQKIIFGEMIDVTVPTGNFGNILAAYFAQKMGVPIGKLYCASNENNILYDFLQTGVYDCKRAFHRTYSPSMDILISSNFERFLYYVLDENPTRIAELMHDLEHNHSFKVNKEEHTRITSIMGSGYATNTQTIETIRRVFETYGYLLDPHTAVADYVATLQAIESRWMITVSTAHPYKFPEALSEAFGESTKDMDIFYKRMEQQTKRSLPKPLQELKTLEKRFTDVVDKDEIASVLYRFIETHELQS